MKTVKELLELARKAIDAGELDQAETHQAQAKALMEQERVEAAYKAVEDEPAKKAVPMQVEDEADRALKAKPFKSVGEFLMAVKAAGNGSVAPELRPLQSRESADEGGFSVVKALGTEYVGSLMDAANAAKALKAAPTGIGESVPQAGGFLVGSDRRDSILSRTYQNGQMLQRAGMDGIGPNSNGMTYFAEAETSRVAGSRRGGIRAYWAAENSAPTASAPTFRKMQLTLKKVVVLVYATDEQLEDTTALGSYINRVLPEELRFMVEDSMVNGSGTGSPLGILNSGATVSVAKETGQAAATITAPNISKMWARRWIGGSNYVWYYNQDIEPQLDQLSFATGTGGNLVYMPPGGLSASPFGTIKGRPAIPVEYCATLGTVGDIILADLGQYQMIDKGGIQEASSMHVRFLQGEQVFRFTYRVDGQPLWDSALTPYKGTNTVSPFVTLATRA